MLSLLLLASVLGLARGQLVMNEYGIPTPDFRYQLFESLTAEEAGSADTLEYNERRCEVAPFADIEQLSLVSIQEQSQERFEAVIELGFVPVNETESDQWYCFINHWSDYYWSELEFWSHAGSIIALGWDEVAWNSIDSDEWPESDELDWDELSADQQQAAANNCYFQQTWDASDVSDRAIGELVAPSTPAPAGANAPAKPTMQQDVDGGAAPTSSASATTGMLASMLVAATMCRS